MTDCLFCTNPGLVYKGDVHPECQTECNRRIDNNICTRCGKNDATGTNVWCNTCNFGSDYEGYPGGSA